MGEFVLYKNLNINRYCVVKKKDSTENLNSALEMKILIYWSESNS